jgi:large subunit ribosomal protein L16
MLMQPKITKFRKHFKLRDSTGLTKDNGLITLGDFGLKATEGGVLNAKQMDTLRANLLKKLKELDKNSKVFLKVMPAIPISKKPAEVRMGGGKGPVEFYGCMVKIGKVIVEVICNADSKKIKEVLASSSNKLPLKTKVIERWI